MVEFQAHQLNQASLWMEDGTLAHQSSALAEVPLVKTGDFLAWSVVWEAENWDESTDRLFILFQNGDALSPIHPDVHADQTPGRYVSELYFLEKNSPKFRIHYAGKHQISSVKVHFFDPGTSHISSSGPAESAPVDTRSACVCPQPAYQSRADWCPDSSCPPNPFPSSTTVTHLIVHHSAGVSVSSDWAAVVRSIWDYHVNVNGWSDIGYNWLVAPTGVMYEGRGDNILGAHFCGTNGGTMGVCMMGDYTDIQPAAGAVSTLEALLAWKSCDEDLDPLGSAFHPGSGLTLNRISGHRDGCATSCPGDAFYPTLPNVRVAVKNYIDNGCEAPLLAAPTSLAVSSVTTSKVVLNWMDNTTTEDGFILERSTGTNDNFTSIATLPANITSFPDLSVEPSTAYFYRIRAFLGSVYSPYSNEVFVSTDVTGSSVALNSQTVRIFPNPADNHTTIAIDNQWFGNMEITLYDALGRQVQATHLVEKTTGAATVRLDLPELPAGVFWVRILQGEAAGLFKLIRE